MLILQLGDLLRSTVYKSIQGLPVFPLKIAQVTGVLR